MTRERLMECPVCGYRTRIQGGIGAVYCGPHQSEDGHYSPAQQMREVSEEPTR